MGKLLPTDHTRPGNTSDVVCSVCHRPWGGLVYVAVVDEFVHRDPDECDHRKKLASQR